MNKFDHQLVLLITFFLHQFSLNYIIEYIDFSEIENH